jgi:hypothetical protein
MEGRKEGRKEQRKEGREGRKGRRRYPFEDEAKVSAEFEGAEKHDVQRRSVFVILGRKEGRN